MPVSVPHGPRQLPPSFCPRGVVDQDLAYGQALAARARDLIKNGFFIEEEKGMKTVFVFITSKYCRVPGKLREPPAFGRKKGTFI